VTNEEAEQLILTQLQLEQPPNGGRARLVEDLGFDSITTYELALLLDEHCSAEFTTDEGILRDHEWHWGRYWDTHLVSISRALFYEGRAARLLDAVKRRETNQAWTNPR
jgi:acyl carrier protein